MKQKGFTLIELLAVIVILAIIALIATPMILGVIESSKRGAVESSAQGYIKGIEQYYVTSQMGGTVEYPTNVDELNGVVSVKGTKPEKGSIVLDENHMIVSGEFCINGYYVGYDGKKAKVDDTKTCEDVKGSIPLTSENCFAFSNGVITDYYDYEENDRSKAKCPREVGIPSTIRGETVTAIGTSAFSEQMIPSWNHSISSSDPLLMNASLAQESDDSVSSKIVAVTIPSTVTTIESYAFAGNELTSVNLPSGLEEIRPGVFSNNQLTSITIPSGVKSIGSSAFDNNQLTRVKIPNGVTYIGAEAFSNNQLTSIDIPNGVEELNRSVFSNNQLTSVTIPSSVTTIGNYAFDDNQLTIVAIPNNVMTIGQYAFSNNQLTSITIPSSVTWIKNSAFNNNQLPDEQAFIYDRLEDGTVDKTCIVSYGGKKRAAVVIPNGVTTIEYAAFDSNQLTSVTIPSSVTTIKTYAFAWNSLTSVTIPSSVKNIEIYAFSGNQLTSVKVIGKSSSAGFTKYGSNIWGWASGYSDSNIEWDLPN